MLRDGAPWVIAYNFSQTVDSCKYIIIQSPDKEGCSRIRVPLTSRGHRVGVVEGDRRVPTLRFAAPHSDIGVDLSVAARERNDSLLEKGICC